MNGNECTLNHDIIGDDSVVNDDIRDGDGVVQICFSFDTTASMYDWLEEVKVKLQGIIGELFDNIKNIEISVICHGDYGEMNNPDSYVIKILDFSNVYTYII